MIPLGDEDWPAARPTEIFPPFYLLSQTFDPAGTCPAAAEAEYDKVSQDESNREVICG